MRYQLVAAGAFAECDEAWAQQKSGARGSDGEDIIDQVIDAGGAASVALV